MCFLAEELDTALHSFKKDGESDTLEKEKAKPNHVHELVAFLNSKGTKHVITKTPPIGMIPANYYESQFAEILVIW